MAAIGGSRAGRTRPVSAPGDWTPFHLGDALLGYWDAEDSASLSLAGSAVTAWADRKGGYAPAQATAGNRPVFSATGFNGRPCVTFDGVDDYLEMTPAPAVFPTGSDPCEIWVLVDQTLPGATTGVTSIAGYGSNAAQRQIGRTSISGVSRGRATVGLGSSNTSINDSAVDFTGIHILRCRFSPTTAALFMDSNAATSIDLIPATSATRFRIGATGIDLVGAYWSGTINSIFITTPLSVDQALQGLAFLKGRAAIN